MGKKHYFFKKYFRPLGLAVTGLTEVLILLEIVVIDSIHLNENSLEKFDRKFDFQTAFFSYDILWSF